MQRPSRDTHAHTHILRPILTFIFPPPLDLYGEQNKLSFLYSTHSICIVLRMNTCPLLHPMTRKENGAIKGYAFSLHNTSLVWKGWNILGCPRLKELPQRCLCFSSVAKCELVTGRQTGRLSEVRGKIGLDAQWTRAVTMISF